jgi:NAD(P)-dependent dehydrogenase (short-subunit alcohol dehydrogenase family)
VRELGRLDVVVANAGISSLSTILEMPSQMWQDMIDTNLTGVFTSVKASLPHVMRSGGGSKSIVIISSAVVGRHNPNIAHYTASKYGVVGFAKALALELAHNGIRVNTVHPTTVDSPMIQNDATWRLFMPDVENPSQADAEKPDSPYVQNNVLPVPWVDAEDVSEMVLFLVSDASRYVTGAQFYIDAGYTIK